MTTEEERNVASAGFTPPGASGDERPTPLDAGVIWTRYGDLQRYVGWTDDDERRLTAAHELIRPRFESLVDDFYGEIQRHDATAAVLGVDEGRIARLKGSLIAWMGELLQGPHDADYVVRRWRVGLRHVEIGLPHVFAIAALSRLRTGMIETLWSRWQGEPHDLFSTVGALNKLLDLDAAVIGEAYEQERVRLREKAERRKMEGALNLERDLNSGLLAFAGAVAIVLDDRGRIVRGNSRFETLLGVEVGKLYGQDWLEQFLSPEDCVRWRSQLFGLQSDAAKFVNATSSLNGTEGEIHVHWTGAAMRDSEGKTLTAFVLGNDVSELYEAQRRATQSERLAAIGEMATGIAHESRASLQHIGWAAEALEADLAEQPSAMLLLAKIRRSQEQLRKLFEDVRAYASPPLLDREPIRLLQTWREAWELTAALRRDRDAELRESVPNPEPHAFGDRVRLVQVFRNLFENSIAATYGPVRVYLQMDIDPTDPSIVKIRVGDNGPGLTDPREANALSVDW